MITSASQARRSSAASGPSSASASASARSTPSGVDCSGTPSSSVAIAFACTSGPGIRSSGHETGWMSCSTGAVAPTTTILSRNVSGSTSPCPTSENV